ncbi:hypothetical protein [Agreia sp. VKM Ac-1783]|uniref:hypothetical protein n=1 Tax=Agreia sp. VKM Ac-1783 TaxID=1938889 RepID=UPI000A389B6D|nr:hypothetical protein [Agreia sp. VKM Ac-1783]
MDEIIAAIFGADIWQIALAVVVAVAGSSAASAWITSAFTSSGNSKTFRRDVRHQALVKLGAAYQLFSTVGAAAHVSTNDDEERIAQVSAEARVAVAQIGDENLLTLVDLFVLAGELYSAKDEETSYVSLDEKFISLVQKITKGIPAK